MQRNIGNRTLLSHNINNNSISEQKNLNFCRVNKSIKKCNFCNNDIQGKYIDVNIKDNEQTKNTKFCSRNCLVEYFKQ